MGPAVSLSLQARPSAPRLTLQGLVLLPHRLQVLQGLLVDGLDLEALGHVHAALLLGGIRLHLQLLALPLPLSQHLVKDPLPLVQGGGRGVGLGWGGDGVRGLPFLCLSPPSAPSLPSLYLSSNSGDPRLLRMGIEFNICGTSTEQEVQK